MKLISGGQTGVDRAVLDVAIENGVDYAGWCPKGGWAEDFPAPPGLLAKYPLLQETPLADPAQRTEWNVRDADACMILVEAGGLEVSGGTALAQDFAHQYRKPRSGRGTRRGERGSNTRCCGCAFSRHVMATASSSPSAARARAKHPAFTATLRRSSGH